MNEAPAQRGLALLWLLALLVVASTLALLRMSHQPVAQPTTTQRALQQAKEGLLGYALAYPETHPKGNPARTALVPGHLPCPNLENTANTGQESPQCGSKGVSALGRLPWTTLGLPPLKDGAGECLWYAVSGHYKNNPKADLLNPDVPGQFAIDLLTPAGRVTLAEDVVAVVIASGPPMPGQTRSPVTDSPCQNALLPAQHLESDAQHGFANAFATPAPESTTRLTLELRAEHLNDQMVWITRQELWAALNQRPELAGQRALFDAAYPQATAQPNGLAQRAISCLRGFALASNGHLPWAAPVTLAAAAPDTFATDAFNDQKNLLAGRLPLHIWDTVRELRTQGTADATIQATLTHPVFSQCTGSDSTGCRLFRADYCPELLPVAGYPTPFDDATKRDSPDGWLDKWKDHLFYAMAPGFQPNRSIPGCQGDTCLQVNGRPYAAVLIVSGHPLSGQNRLKPAEKQQAANYLEGGNASSLNQNGRIFAEEGNDQLVCLRGDLSISPRCRD